MASPQRSSGASQELEIQEIRSWAGISTSPSGSNGGNLGDSKTDEIRSWHQTATASHSVVKDSHSAVGVAAGQEELRSWGSFNDNHVTPALSDAPQHNAANQSDHTGLPSGQVVRRNNVRSAEKVLPVSVQQSPSSQPRKNKKSPSNRIRLSPFRTLPKLGIAAARKGGIASFVDACLRSFGQVFFQNSPVSGALFIIALLASSTPVMAAVAVLAVVSANLFSIAFEYDSGLRSSGIWGYNASLVGCGLTVGDIAQQPTRLAGRYIQRL